MKVESSPGSNPTIVDVIESVKPTGPQSSKACSVWNLIYIDGDVLQAKVINERFTNYTQYSYKVCPSSVTTLIGVSFLFLVKSVGSQFVDSSDRACILAPDGRLLSEPDGVDPEKVFGHG